MKIFKFIALLIFTLLIWTAIIGYGFIDGFLLRPITSDNTPAGFIEAVNEKIEADFVGNLAMVLIEDGQVAQDFFYSIDEPVNNNTVYQVASVSKWVTSFGVMKLAEEGRVDLDKPIDDYLTRWHLPQSEFDNRKVTIRRLLSHSSGLVDDLGYNGYEPGETVQSIEKSLTKASDGWYDDAVARVGKDPGSVYMYSGAGYTILQLLIEEISGLSFQDYMTQTVFEPLGMNNSTFVLSENPNLQLAQLFNGDGSIAPPLKFTALAAASLYTCTADLIKFMQACIAHNPVLSRETIALMSQPEAYRGDIGVYGLGPHLYSQNDPNSLIIGHDGSGSYINTAARIDLKSKNGIIILERGHQSLASNMADEWMYSNAGIADYVVMQRNMTYVATILIAGVLVIIGLFIYLYRKGKRNSSES